jgi:hypothetical protein
MPVHDAKTDFTASRAASGRYFERCKELRAHGAEMFILSRISHPQQWAAWKTYYRAHGLFASADLMEDGRIEKPVPCLDPADFEHREPVVDRRVKDD